MCPPTVSHLEGSEGELCEQFDEAKGPSGMFVHHKGKDDLMCSQEGDERQSGLGKSGERG